MSNDPEFRELNTIESIEDLVALLENLNEDCKEAGEQVVPLTDKEYYTEQIMNILEIPDEAIARLLADAVALYMES